MTTRNKLIAGFAFAVCGVVLAGLVGAIAYQLFYMFDHINFFQNITVIDGAESVTKTCGLYFGIGDGAGECYFIQ